MSAGTLLGCPKSTQLLHPIPGQQRSMQMQLCLPRRCANTLEHMLYRWSICLSCLCAEVHEPRIPVALWPGAQLARFCMLSPQHQGCSADGPAAGSVPCRARTGGLFCSRGLANAGARGPVRRSAARGLGARGLCTEACNTFRLDADGVADDSCAARAAADGPNWPSVCGICGGRALARPRRLVVAPSSRLGRPCCIPCASCRRWRCSALYDGMEAAPAAMLGCCAWLSGPALGKGCNSAALPIGCG